MTPRLIVVGNCFSHVTGTRGVCEDLADQLMLRGWQVSRTSDKPNRILRLIDITATLWRKRADYDLAEIDVYSGNAFFLAETAAAVLRQARKPYVLNLHGGNLPEFSQRWHGRVFRLLNSAAAVVTPSRHLKQALSVLREDIVQMPNGVDLSRYEFRQRKHVQPRLAWLRAFHEVYAPTMAVEAAALLTHEFPNLELAMFGPDKGLLQATADKARELGVNLSTPGKIPKSTVPAALAPYDIFLNTTRAESFGVSVIEAAALGMCIVTTNIGELPHIWTHDSDALLVPPDDAQTMANAVRRILTEPELAEQLSRNARVRAETFDWGAVLPQWETLLTAVSR